MSYEFADLTIPYDGRMLEIALNMFVDECAEGVEYDVVVRGTNGDFIAQFGFHGDHALGGEQLEQSVRKAYDEWKKSV
jgi:hypothetical protein